MKVYLGLGDVAFGPAEAPGGQRYQVRLPGRRRWPHLPEKRCCDVAGAVSKCLTSCRIFQVTLLPESALRLADSDHQSVFSNPQRVFSVILFSLIELTGICSKNCVWGCVFPHGTEAWAGRRPCLTPAAGKCLAPSRASVMLEK